MKSFKKSLVIFSWYPSFPYLTYLLSFVEKILILPKTSLLNNLQPRPPPHLPPPLYYPHSPPLQSKPPSQIPPHITEVITPFLHNNLPSLLALPFKPRPLRTVD